MTRHMPMEETDHILARAESFIKEKVLPIDNDLVSMTWDKASIVLEGLRDEVRSLGLWAPQMHTEYGGLGLTHEQHGRLSGILGMSPAGHYIFNCQAPDAGNMEILHEYGTEKQKATYLLPLVKGQIRSCFSMTEPGNAGSNPLMMDTVAVMEGDEWVISGHKWFTSSADGAMFAIVMAVTDPENPNPYKRASQIIVPADTPGFQLVRNIPVMGEAGGGYFSHAEIRYDRCRVPYENILGGEGEGFAIAQSRLGPGRIHHCMRWLGICERAFDMMCSYAVQRMMSPGKPLAEKQAIQIWIAELRAEINAARMLVLDAARKIDQKGQEQARVEISIIKFYVANVLQKTLDRAIQVHGALGVTDDIILGWWYRHERAARIYDGPDETHKVRVAKEILKKYTKHSGHG